VDTRTKIVTGLADFNPPRPLLLATGRFDILRMEMVRELAAARERTGARSLAVVLGPLVDELAPLPARAEMAAALRVIDYVFIVPDGDLAALASALQPIEIISLEQADAQRTRQLIEHVHSRHL
jgi:hypothetical protein